jgi:hypothetical protein
MRRTLLTPCLALLAGLAVGGCSDAALGDPATEPAATTTSSTADGAETAAGRSLPPLGHGGPLDHQPHPGAAGTSVSRGSSAGMAGEASGDLTRPIDPAENTGFAPDAPGEDTASGTLSRPIDPAENTGFAPDAPGAEDGDIAAQSDGAPIAVGVGDTAGTERDQALNARIRQSLASEPDLVEAVTRLRLVTVDGVVTLQGQVATAEAKEALASAVSAQEGVKKVNNHVAIGAQ